MTAPISALPRPPLSSSLLTLVVGLVLWLAPARLGALGQEHMVTFAPEDGAFVLANAGTSAALWVDSSDHAGVVRAVRDLQADLKRVTGREPVLQSASKTMTGKSVVIIGTLGKSALIDQLVSSGKLETKDLAGKWEASIAQVVTAPVAGVDQALVIVGSDKRGTIYGVYTLSEQIGVSPWYWWADVPVQRRDSLFVRPGRFASGEPVVKYRGIFLNDEAPALSGWANEKFGGFNHAFYAHVFELILRLRGNYLWPAMWGSAFNDDDPKNPLLADEYGIVMGTSHHEPLMRAHDEWRRYGEGAWNYATNEAALREFWRGGVERVKNFEKIVSVGMRGDGDEAMSEETNVALLERIVADQRAILSDVSGKPASEIPQLWALYKEVQGYYENGMRVPDDVTLLWCDDNWGNIRRLPTPAERKRQGGAGVYYHFDYVGGPRNYKWLNTVPLTKIWEQMHLAWKHDANRIWIVNVGDLKPMEFPIEFFLTLAWDPARWPYEKLGEYSQAWAAREFGAEHAAEVASLINGYTKLNGRRKPEMLAPDTFSFVNDNEAERVAAEWSGLVKRAEALQARLPADARDAFFQLVLYPVKASATVQEIYFATGRNRLYAQQGRAEASAQAQRARNLFADEAELVRQYHTLRGGKWNHQMAQIKMGYTTWQQPEIETMPAVFEVRPRAGASMALAVEGSATAYPSYGARAAAVPPLDSIRGGSRWLEVFNRGQQPFTFKVATSAPWLVATPASGDVGETVRVRLSADWPRVPAGAADASVTVEASTGERVTVNVPVLKRELDPTFRGFVESDRHVAMEAPHYSRAVPGAEASWQTLPDFGRTLGGVTPFPVTRPARAPGADSARLEYDVHLDSTGELKVELHCAPSLDFQSGAGLQLAVAFDDAEPQVVKLDTWQTLQTWEKSVADGVRRVVTKHTISKPGPHVLKLWSVTPGIVVQRIVIDAGGVRPSYLGPVESPHVGDARAP